jgi:hypothetical protein
MPIEKAQWLVKGRVIYAYADGGLTVDDFEQHNQNMLHLIENGQPLVHAVLDTGEDFAILQPSLRIARNIFTFARHPALGWIAQVQSRSNSFAFLSTLLAKLMRVRFRHCDSVDEALDFLQEIDKSVRWDMMDTSIIHESSKSSPT